MRPRVVFAFAVVAALTVPLLSVGTSGAAKKPTVRIGVIAPINGGLTSFGQGINNSVQLAVDQANEEKAIPGWRIKVRSLDDSSDPLKGAAAAKLLAADKAVAAVVGPYNSGVAEAALPALKGKVALLSPSNTLTSLTLGPDATKPERPHKNYYRLVGPDSLQAQFLAQQAKKLGYTKVAVVNETKAVSKGLADQFVTAFKAGGGAVTVQTTVPDGATDFSAFLTAAAPTTPQMIFFGGEYNVAATLRTQATAAGLTVPVMGGDGMNDPAYITGAGAAAAGSYASGVGTPIAKQPGGMPFAFDYQAAGFGNNPTDYGPYAYDATNLLIDVLKGQLKGKSSVPSDLRSKVIAAVQKEKTTGVTGSISFDQYGDPTSPTFTLYTVSGSPLAWTPVTP